METLNTNLEEQTMTDSHLKLTIPQEGTHASGKSLSEVSSGCPTDSGGGTNKRIDLKAVGGLAAQTTSSKQKVMVTNTAAVRGVHTSSLHRYASDPQLNKTIDPFGRSPRIQRSPTKTKPENAKIAMTDDVSSVITGSDNLVNLKQQIESLQEYVKNRNNVHHEIKKMICLIKSSFLDLSKEVIDMRSNTQKSDQTKRKIAAVATQTDPEPKTQTHGNLTVASSQTPRVVFNKPPGDKRRRDGDMGGTSGQSPKLKKSRGEQNAPETITIDNDNVKSGGTLSENPLDRDWTKVSRKKTDKKSTPSAPPAISKRSRPDAIILESIGTTSYAEILRKVKGDPNLSDLGDKVVRIRRTQKGHMMFELKRSEDSKGELYQEMVVSAVGDLAKVKVLTEVITIVCKDLDEVTSKEDLLKAFKDKFNLPTLEESSIRSIKKSYDGSQTAIICLPLEVAKKVLLAGKIKVGWTVCRLREFIRPVSCFRCLGFGHIAKSCQGVDRSKSCRRCGEEGHIARNCCRTPRCMLCTDDTDKPISHITGSTECPKYRSASIAARA